MADGSKDDNGKLPWRLLLAGPALGAAREIVRVLQWGAWHRPRSAGLSGYGENNWVEVKNAKQRYFDAALRHLTARLQGERIDPDSGEWKLLHLAEASCCVIFMTALDVMERLDETPATDVKGPLEGSD